MMDFGALVCTPVSPACGDCPLAGHCRSLSSGRVSLLPVRKSPTAVQERRFCYVYVRCPGWTAIRRRGRGDIWQGLWEPLLCDTPPAGARLLRRDVRHQLTHRTIIADFYLLDCAQRPPLPDGYIWIQEAELDSYAKPRLFQLLLESLRLQ